MKQNVIYAKNRLTDKNDYYKSSQTKEKTSEINRIKLKKTKIYLNQCGTK